MPDIHPIHPSQAAARNRSAAPWPLLWLVAILLFLLTGCQGETPAVVGTPAPAVSLSDCQIGAEGVSLRLSARCGTLTVPENPDDPAGRQIDLRLAVIPAVSRSPEPDPLFILAGGPGQAATETYVQISGAFQRIHQNRDIVLVDQRGTGGSNPLTCPASETGVDYSADSEDTQRYLQECLQSLDADPAFYTTPLFAADLERVRQALGYGKINLYGVSYGTRSALTYLKMFPDSVRAVILDGVVPMQEPLGIDVARDAQNAIDLILERCSTDAACSQAFPDIQQEFDELVAALREQPVEVSIVHPRSGEPVELSFSIEQLAVAVRLASYAPETAALLPLLIHKAGAEGDYGLLAALYLIVTEQLSDTIALGLNNTVLCSEDMPFMPLEEARRAGEGTYYGDLQIEALETACSVWPRGSIPADYKEPVQSSVPVLLLSGEVDPVTPPENAELAAQTLPNSLHLVAPGMGHNVIMRGCLPRVASDFIASGSVNGLDTDCVNEIVPSPFFVNFSGPLPLIAGE